ncbi:exonuclease domain-containing protein [Falsibacillus pallidus]|uniref:DNA polymerase-3 subunit epsilon n=1 Tax=Falsibacillus pallidus TaxID=493781 RepID=A0A370GWH1_9BACI|nr:exonuclease domain-containing protein [Falsibacillus pallidus]RDI48007.1 DNA polymerase-3 subunit epsilon [Falsibacillus pallidus]
MEQNKKIAIVLDIETTGLSPYKNEIIELYMIKFSFDKETGQLIERLDEYSALNEPNSRISSQITQLTGITNEMVKGHLLDFEEILDFCRDSEYFIAHNASFDRSFLIQVLPDLVDRKWHCSMRHVKWKNYGFADMKLNTLLRAHRIKNEHAHRAGSDTLSTLKLLLQSNPDGHTYLRELVNRKPMAPPAKKPIQNRRNTIRDLEKAKREMAASREKGRKN